MSAKNYIRKKAKKLCLIRQIVTKKSQLSRILTEPLNPRVQENKEIFIIKYCVRCVLFPLLELKTLE